MFTPALCVKAKAVIHGPGRHNLLATMRALANCHRSDSEPGEGVTTISHTPRKLRKEDCWEFIACMGNKVSSRLAWGIEWDHVFINQSNKQKTQVIMKTTQPRNKVTWTQIFMHNMVTITNIKLFVIECRKYQLKFLIAGNYKFVFKKPLAHCPIVIINNTEWKPIRLEI